MKQLLLLAFVLCSTAALAQTPCIGGMAGAYPCNGYDLQSHIPLSTMNTTGANDSWGWIDPNNNDEYALVGLEDGTAFIDISNPNAPVYLGKLPTQTSSSQWRDIKVYNNYAFIVSEASGHGIQIFDLTRLRNVSNPPVTFTVDAHFNGFGSAHNIVINGDTGYAYGVGADTYVGSHFVNIQDPLNPIDAGGFSGDGYTHDAQVVTYSGPDATYLGREILISSSGSDSVVSIVDVTDKSNPQSIATISYSNVGYTHQAWFTEDQRYLLLGDEFDESAVGFNTRTIVFDLLDLDNPVMDFEYFGPTAAIDHNGYVVGNTYFLANYSAGMRAIDISGIGSNSMNEIGFFDTYPSNNNANFSGAWNVYPFFNSGNIMICDRSGGFFLVKSSSPDTTDPVAVCQNITIALDINGEAVVNPALVDGGSFDDSGFFTLQLSENTFDCSQIGPQAVTLTVTDPSGNTDSCTATITVVDDLAPQLDCLSNATVGYDPGADYYTLPDYALNGDITATDNCDGTPNIVQTPSAGTQLTEGTYTINFDSSDSAGNSNNCSFVLTVQEILTVDDFSFERGITIFPNPAAETITVGSQHIPITSIKVFDVTGKQVYSQYNMDTLSETVAIDSFSKGLYFITLNGLVTKRLIKK
ncbi:choice-of-anchor B family protein [Altibacter sp.]|uniref:choice-of-anchor B family protein n=1 Tax=Altibacter sp. TaxID=2024823 RepID=UPI00338EACD8